MESNKDSKLEIEIDRKDILNIMYKEWNKWLKERGKATTLMAIGSGAVFLGLASKNYSLASVGLGTQLVGYGFKEHYSNKLDESSKKIDDYTYRNKKETKK